MIKSYRSSHWRCSIKKVFLKILKDPESLFKLSFRLQVCNFIKKETLLAQAFSCAFCEMFRNTFFTEHLQTTAAKTKNVSYMMGLVFRIFIINITKNISKNTTFCLKMLMSENIYFIFSKKASSTGPATPWCTGKPLPPHFFAQQNEKMETKEKKVFKTETIKSLSPMLKCCCFSHSRASRIKKCFLSANYRRQYFSALLLNPFDRPCSI